MMRHRIRLHRRPQRRVPVTPHEAGSRGVPWPSCGCATCDTAREDAETRADRDHQAKIADLVGLTDDDL